MPLERIYRRYYVHLRGIQQELTKTKANGLSVVDTQFTEIVEDELQKVNQFTSLKQQELIMELQITNKNLQSFIRLLTGPKQNSATPETSSPKHALPELTEQEKRLFLGDMENLLSEISREIVHLHRYVRVNFSFLGRAALFFDELFTRSTSPWFLAQLIREPFASCDVDRLLVRLSLCWEKFRLASGIVNKTIKLGENSEAWKPPESFIRNTTKYWIRPNQVAAAKAFIVRFVPYLVFGFSSKDLEFLVNPLELSSSKRHDETEVKEGQLVSSVYLDSEGGYSYYNRLGRFEGAELTRCRWYGENDGNPYKEVFVERKTHHESWSGDCSAKERFSLPQKRVFDFLKGKVNIDQWAAHLAQSRGVSQTDKKIANLLRLGNDISAVISKYKLQPMVRTSYLRSAFQASDNNDVRFSLDVNLCMVDEFQPNFHPEPPWCRTAEEILGKDQVVRFPFAVLEVKLQCEQPAWVSQLLHESQAMMVYKFSKFQHGMAFLHRDKIGHYGLPHWVPDFENRGYVPGFSIPPSTRRDLTIGGFSSSQQQVNWGPQFKPAEPPSLSSSDASPIWRRSVSLQSSRYNKLFTATETRRSLLLANFYPGAKKSVDGAPNPRGNTGKTAVVAEQEGAKLAESIHQRSLNIRKLDPKSVFAAERTFLHYTHKCLFVAAAGIAVLTWGTAHWSSRIVGTVLVLTVCVGIGGAYIMMTSRMARIVNRTTKELLRERLDDQWSPVLATGVMGSVLTIVLIFEACFKSNGSGSMTA